MGLFKVIKLGNLIGPLFWVSTTYLTITYGPTVIAKIRHKEPLIETQVNEKISPNEVLGESEGQPKDQTVYQDTTGTDQSNELTWQDLTEEPRQISEYVREVIEKTTRQIIEKSGTEIEETKTEITNNVCQQIIEEIKKQCAN